MALGYLRAAHGGGAGSRLAGFGRLVLAIGRRAAGRGSR
jgi:hypothetical protein